MEAIIPMQAIAFTGHRPDKLVGYERDLYTGFTKDLACMLYDKYYIAGVRKFISGGAQGFDQLAFWAVEKMRRYNALTDIQNIVYVPFRGQERMWKDEGCFSKSDYQKMLSFADNVVILEKTAFTRSEVVSALMRRNREMVDSADAICALNNDSNWQSSRGGTASAMQYAQSKGKRIDRIRFSFTGTPPDQTPLVITGFEKDICI